MHLNHRELPDKHTADLLHPTIYPWEVGPAVVELQELLCAYGFPLKLDGDFGWRTEAAVRTFQRQHRLRVDGIVGPQTWLVLQQYVKPGCRPLHHGHTGHDVYELQGLLQIHGHVLRRDGSFGNETEEAVKAFQHRHHLKANGMVCSVTWTLLRAGKPIQQPSTKRGWLINAGKWW